MRTRAIDSSHHKIKRERERKKRLTHDDDGAD